MQHGQVRSVRRLATFGMLLRVSVYAALFYTCPESWHVTKQVALYGYGTSLGVTNMDAQEPNGIKPHYPSVPQSSAALHSPVTKHKHASPA